MRKFSMTLTVALCALLLFAGCAAGPPADGAAQDILVSEPTPAPEGMQKVFGRDMTLAALGEFPEGMKNAMLTEAEACGIPLSFVDTAEEAATADLAILLDPEEAIISQIPQKVVITCDAELAKQTDGIFLNGEGALELSFDALMNYSGHEAPVRVLGLFTGEDSPAYIQYQAMTAEGKLQSRGVFFAGESCKEELCARLSEIVPGLLDSIYAENEELALLAFETLKEAERNDAVEVIAPVLSDAILAAMEEEHFLMGAGVGIDVYSVGTFAVRKAISTLAGESTETLSFAPETVLSDTVYALRKAAEEGETLADLLTQRSAELPLDDAAQYLREYTANRK